VQHAGEAHGVVVIRDITERTMRRLQDEFLALASHEFRTPLTPARGYLELIPAALAARDNDRVAHFAAAALEQILHLDALVSDVLDVGRLQGGALRLEREWLDFAAVVERAAVAARMQEGSPPIEVDLPDEPVPVEGDVRRLEQVVANLLSNAIVHAATPRIQVRLRRAEGAAVLEVQDDGRGIPATDLPRLFSRFYQVERPDRPSRGGLGLGLYLVQELVEAHGGTVTVVSTPGQGTTFTVRLALTPGE
jgi:two-component system CheB/CheR fusion protein